MSSGKINKILTYTKKCLDGSNKIFKSITLLIYKF